MTTPYYEDDTVTLHHGDALTVARTLALKSVQTIVTSPPYYGLRDYGDDAQLGGESSVGDYVANMVALFSSLRDVLADDTGEREYTGKRNKRTVWTVATQPFSGAHFAVYPPELIRPCILAGTREGDTVLDPFSGSGTTGMVATQEGRKYVGIELNREYIDLSLRTRFAQPSLNFGDAS